MMLLLKQMARLRLRLRTLQVAACDEEDSWRISSLRKALEQQKQHLSQWEQAVAAQLESIVSSQTRVMISASSST